MIEDLQKEMGLRKLGNRLGRTYLEGFTPEWVFFVEDSLIKIYLIIPFTLSLRTQF